MGAFVLPWSGAFPEIEKEVAILFCHLLSMGPEEGTKSLGDQKRSAGYSDLELDRIIKRLCSDLESHMLELCHWRSDLPLAFLE